MILFLLFRYTIFYASIIIVHRLYEAKVETHVLLFQFIVFLRGSAVSNAFSQRSRIQCQNWSRQLIQ